MSNQSTPRLATAFLPPTDSLTMTGQARANEQRAEAERNQRIEQGAPTMQDLRAQMDALLGNRS